MAIHVMADNNKDIMARTDAAMMWGNSAMPDDFVVAGVANEFSLTSSGRVATIQPGLASILGFHLLSDANVSVTVPASQAGFIVARIDHSKSAGYEGSIIAVASLTKQNLLNNGTVRDIPLYSYTAHATTPVFTKVADSFAAKDMIRLVNVLNKNAITNLAPNAVRYYTFTVPAGYSFIGTLQHSTTLLVSCGRSGNKFHLRNTTASNVNISAGTTIAHLLFARTGVFSLGADQSLAGTTS